MGEVDGEEMRDYKVAVTANSKLILSAATTSKEELNQFVSIYHIYSNDTLTLYIYEKYNQAYLLNVHQYS